MWGAVGPFDKKQAALLKHWERGCRKWGGSWWAPGGAFQPRGAASAKALGQGWVLWLEARGAGVV